jgi:dsRNA-specific ribonuclease
MCATLSSFKSQLNEFCQQHRIDYPTYRMEGTRGQPHQRSFLMAVDVNQSTFEGSWKTTIKEAEGEAAKAALRELSPEVELANLQSMAASREVELTNPQSMPRTELSALCVANAWAEPAFTVTENGGRFDCCLTMHDGRVFCGSGPRKVIAQAAACQQALEDSRSLVQLPQEAVGAWMALRQTASVRHGLQVQSSGNTLSLAAKTAC